MQTLAALHWNISPEIISIGFVTLRWYSLLFVSGFIIGYEIMRKVFRLEGRTIKDLDALAITMMISAILGARLGHCFFYDPMYYFENPMRILEIWKGGLASHGGTIGILIGLWLYSRKRKPDITYQWILDRIIIPIPLAGALIRIGNFMNSEIVGSPTDAPWGVVFERYDDLVRHPAQLYEAGAYILIFIYLFRRYFKLGGDIPRFQFLGIFLTLLFSARFVIEFFKEVQVDYEQAWLLDTGQLLSIPFIILGIVLWVKSRKR